MRIKILLMAVVLAGLLFSLSASAQQCENPVTTEPSCGVVPIKQLSYVTTTEVDKFDQSLGKLVQVRMTAQACGYETAELDSEDETAQEFQIIALARVIPNLPKIGEETFQIKLDETFDVSADDEPGPNNANYAGPDYSGILSIGSQAEPECTDLREWIFTNESDLALFKGNAGDKLQIPVRTQSAITVIGSVLQESRSSAFMGFEICVEYTYCPPTLCINGTKINDCTGAGIEGWQITLKDSTGAVIDQTHTGPAGKYSFCGLEPGTYTVCEEDRAGWVHLDEPCREVILEDANVDGVDFNNAPTFCISGHKYNSKTGAGIEGWKITLLDANGNEIANKLTGPGGYYEFCGLAPGDYVVREETRSGWKPITPTSIPVTLDCANSENNDFENEPVVNLVCVCPFFLKNELYSASCKEVKVVDASKGILANDQAGSVVLNPESITIDPKYGTIEVHEDGSFVYDPTVATGKLYSGLYVMFKYTANNGLCDSQYPGIAKIQLRC